MGISEAAGRGVTSGGNGCTEDELARFDRDGFLIVKALYRPDEIAVISRAIDELAGLPQESGRQMAYLEDSLVEKGKKLLARIEKFVEYQEELRGLVYSERLVGRVRQLLGDHPVLFKEKINFKMPGGHGFTPHQDIQPGWDAYAAYFISVSVAVDENTEENGCLELAPGHHKRGMIGRQWEPLQGRELEGMDFVKFPMAPGDVALFDCFTPHQSAPNLSRHPRRDVYLTYNRLSEGDQRERYFADKRRSYPPDFEREPGREYTFRV